MALGPFTITNAREQDVDFSKPYFDQGIGIILRVGYSGTVRCFEFLKKKYFDQKYIRLSAMIYFTLSLNDIYFKWLTLEIFEVKTFKINFNMHIKGP